MINGEKQQQQQPAGGSSIAQQVLPTAVVLHPTTGQPIPLYLNNPAKSIIALPIANDFQLPSDQLLKNHASATSTVTAVQPTKSAGAAARATRVNKRKQKSQGSSEAAVTTTVTTEQTSPATQQQQQQPANKAELRAVGSLLYVHNTR